MRTISLMLVLLAGTIAPARAQDAAKHWIFFTDKQPDATARLEPDSATPAALARRATRGRQLDPMLDAPLTPAYLDALRDLGVAPLVESRWLNGVSAVLTDAERARVEALPFVRALRPVGIVAPAAEQAPAPLAFAAPVQDRRSAYRLDYGASAGQLELVNAVPVLEEGLSGAGVKLGIIDTGLGNNLASHPATATMVSDGRFVLSQDFTGLPADASTHGFSVISVAAGYDPGQLIGPAYGAMVYHARTEYTPTETNQEEDNFVAGLEWMEAQGVDVVNVSLGYSTFDAGQRSYTYAEMDGNTGVTTIAADLAVEHGMIVVSAAGNEGCGSPTLCWYYITTPSDGKNVISVGAVNTGGLLVDFSGRGPTADGRTKPDIVAQGQSVYLASGTSYASSNGTSFASPMVAGIVTLLLEANPALTPLQVADILRTTASEAATPDFGRGYGIVNTEAAVQAARDLIITGVESPETAASFELEAPYPNPVLDRATLTLHNAGAPIHARLTVYNSLGQEVTTGFDGTLPTGRQPLEIDLRDQPAGLYLYRLDLGGAIRTGTLVRL